MALQKYLLCIIVVFALIGFTSVFYYGYRDQSGLLLLREQNKNVSSTTVANKYNVSNKNLLLKHIEQCPECVLFLFTNKTLSGTHAIFDILNEIPSQSKAIFYPLTMKLNYNQPIPYYTILSRNQTETVINIRQYWINYLKKIDNIKKDSILNFILESLRNPIQTADYSWPNKTKLILYYTRFFGSPYWYNKNEDSVYANDLNFNSCPLSVNACHVTIDHKLFPKSDAALVHMRESFNYKKLRNVTRQPNQRFVFFLKESPVHSPTFTSERFGQIFNYTQTYRPDSDITATTLKNYFWLFDHKIYPNYDFESIMKTKVSGKRMVAIISNCRASSNRLKYINELKEHTSVDVYGGCGTSCSHKSNCHQFAFSTYKFYLAFENSICDEYVTEKFFYALQSARIVPVVLGWARYDHYIPASAYIDVRNFKSPRHLAEYIDYLDKNTTAYLEYFRWRQYALHIKLPSYICELCLKLFLDDRDHKQQSLEHIDTYWNRKNQCHTFQKYSNDTWLMQ